MAQEDKVDAIKLYFNELSKHPLLTPKQEVHLFKKIADSEKELKRLLCRRKTKKLSQQIYHLKRKIHKYKQKVIKANLRLVVSVAKGYSHPFLSFLDFIHAGNLGLVKAVDKFKYEKGFKFSTYAPYWIIKYIRKEMVKVSRPPTWPLEIVDEDGEKVNLIDIIPDLKTPSPEDTVLELLGKMEMEQMLSTILSEQEKVVIERRYDISKRGQIWSLKEIGDLYNISPQRVYKIELEAIRKMKETAKEWRQEGEL